MTWINTVTFGSANVGQWEPRVDTFFAVQCKHHINSTESGTIKVVQKYLDWLAKAIVFVLDYNHCYVKRQ